jgi:hypothetical protein
MQLRAMRCGRTAGLRAKWRWPRDDPPGGVNGGSAWGVNGPGRYQEP